jgi:hypothetical protein
VQQAGVADFGAPLAPLQSLTQSLYVRPLDIELEQFAVVKDVSSLLVL